MNIRQLYIGMRVKHPAYGEGDIKAITEHTAEVLFEDGKRTISPDGSALQPAQAQIAISGIELPLEHFIERVARTVIEELGLEKPNESIEELGGRWGEGKMVLQPADTSLQSKELPIETFFHKIVMMRNQLRVLEQKINAHEKLSDAEKVDMQQYITRCYGSMTTFNVLFRNKEDQF
jgi:hypothetical protein